jgi:hypothetical protein
MPKRTTTGKPKLSELNITYLRKQWRAIAEVRKRIMKVLINERVRNALIDAGVRPYLARHLAASDSGMADTLLRDRWTSLEEIFAANFDPKDVDRVFREIEKEK